MDVNECHCCATAEEEAEPEDVKLTERHAEGCTDDEAEGVKGDTGDKR